MRATISKRLAELAGQAIKRGVRLRQDNCGGHSNDDEAPSAEAIERARTEGAAFVALLLRLDTTRRELDEAVDAARKAGDADLATILECDIDASLPDLEEAQSKSAKLQVRLKASLALADKRVEMAHVSVLTLRRASLHSVRLATSAAREAFTSMLPPNLFDESEEMEALFMRSSMFKACMMAQDAVESLAGAVPIENNELWGKRMPRPFRVDPLPVTQGVPVRDGFNAIDVAVAISNVMEIESKSAMFLASMKCDPLTAIW